MIDLGRITAFRGVSENGLLRLAQGTTQHRFSAGKTIIEKGREVSGAYFVVEGRLRVFTYAPSGREATLYLIDPGETCILALNSLFNKLLYPAWVATEAETTVAVVPGALYHSLFGSERVIQDLTVRSLATLVFRLMDELEEVHSCTLDQRLAAFLLRHASTEGAVRKTQSEVAAHIGTTREVVARLIGRLVSESVVASGRGVVRILDPSRLADLAR